MSRKGNPPTLSVGTQTVTALWRTVWRFLFVVQSLSCVQLFATPWTAAGQATLSFTISQTLLKFSCPLSQWCHPTISSSVIPFSSCPQSFPGSRSLMSQLFTSGGQSIELQLQHQSIDLFDLLTVQGTLRSLLQHYSLKALILWHSAFFMVQLSHLYMTTGKIIAETMAIVKLS